ncbi:SPOR domain-containing protein [Persephonella sp.]
MDQDLKDTIKKLEEAKTKQERIEKIIIILSGLLIIVIFSVIGINIYSGKNETISEPEIDIVAERTPDKVKNEIPLHQNITETKESEKYKKEQEKTEKKEVKQTQTQNKEKKPEEVEKPVKKEKIVQKKPEPVKKASPSTPPKGYYYIQLGAFSSEKKAKKYVSDLKKKNVYIIKEKGLYKVLLGRFKTSKEAYKYLRDNDMKGFVRKL